MLRNYLLIAWRTFQRDRLFTLLNVLGLSVGLATELLLFAYVRFELTFDHQHPHHERLMRVSIKLTQEDGERLFSGNSPSSGPVLVEDFPEAEAFCRISTRSGQEWLVSRQENGKAGASFREKGIFFADSSLMDVFSIPLVEGRKEEVLHDPFTVLISEKIAQKLFPDEEAIGQRVYLGGLNGAMRVDGIFRLPQNMHLQAEIIGSRATLLAEHPGNFARQYQDQAKGSFYGAVDNVYVRLAEGADVESLAAKVNPLLPDWYGDWFARYSASHPERKISYLFTPVSRLRFQEGFTTGSSILPFPIKNIREVYFMGIIGALVLLIAWINYVNLSTARTMRRVKEVGLRKVVGARRRHIMLQFFTETLLVKGIAVLIGLVAIQLGYEQLIASNGWLAFWSWGEPMLWLSIGLFWIGGTFLAGIYPAWVLARLGPSAMLGYKGLSDRKGGRLRRGLVVLQFGMTMGLLLGSFAVFQQMDYLFEKDLGIDLDDKIVVKAPVYKSQDFWRSYASFERQARTLSGVRAYTASQNLPGDGRFNGLWNMKLKGGPPGGEQKGGIIGFSGGSVAHDFADVYDLTFLGGRNFSREFASDSTAMILSRKAAESLGFEDPLDALGQIIMPRNEAWEAHVIGIIEDYHLISLQNLDQADQSGYEGIALYLYNYLYGYDSFLSLNYFTFQLEQGGQKQALAGIEQAFRQSFTGEPFEYFYHEDFFNQQYQPELGFRNTFLFFTLLAIFIACLGLYGLSAYTAQQRTKEISIRKVSGASEWQVLRLLGWEYLRLLFLAVLISLPLTGWAVYSWLQTFEFHISLNAILFIVPVLLVMLLSGATVVSETLRLSRSNPAEMLRHE